MQNKEIINKFSKHLFWDVDRSKLDMEKYKSYIVQRVLEYGIMNDWRIIKEYYGINKIAKIASELRVLDERALSFISAIAGMPKEKFRCYREKLLNWLYLNFRCVY